MNIIVQEEGKSQLGLCEASTYILKYKHKKKLCIRECDKRKEKQRKKNYVFVHVKY